MSEWSQQLKSTTRNVLSMQNMEPFLLNLAMGRKGVILKNANGNFGIITMESCNTQCYQILEVESSRHIDSYSSIEDLLTGGWVVD